MECKICNQIFNNDKSFHAHLKKHNLYQAEYYCTHYPRSSLYYRQQIPFKNKKQYFGVIQSNVPEHNYKDLEKEVKGFVRY